MGWVQPVIRHFVGNEPVHVWFQSEMEEWFWHRGWSRPGHDHNKLECGIGHMQVLIFHCNYCFAIIIFTVLFKCFY